MDRLFEDKNGMPLIHFDLVIVDDPGPGDDWYHSFQGEIVDLGEDSCIVQDGEFNEWTVKYEQIEIAE